MYLRFAAFYHSMTSGPLYLMMLLNLEHCTAAES